LLLEQLPMEENIRFTSAQLVVEPLLDEPLEERIPSNLSKNPRGLMMMLAAITSMMIVKAAQKIIPAVFDAALTGTAAGMAGASAPRMGPTGACTVPHCAGMIFAGGVGGAMRNG